MVRELTRKQAAAWLSGCFVLFFLLTVNPLLFQSYWENEADYVLRAKLPIPLIASSLVPDQSLLYYFLLHGWIKFFGAGEAAVRSLSVLFGLGSLFFCYRLARTFLGNRGVALVAAFFCATSSFLVEFSQEAKHWTLFVFLTLGSLFFLSRWMEKKESKYFWLSLGLGLLNLDACLYAFFVFPVQLIFMWIDNDRSRRAIQAAFFASCLLMGLKWVHLWSGFQYVSARGAQWGLPATFPDFFLTLYRQLFYYTQKAVLPLHAQISLIIAYGFFLLGILRMETKKALMISLLFLFPLAVSYSIADTASVRNRYFIHLIPLFWMTTTYGLARLKPFFLRGLMIALICLGTFNSLFNYFKLHRKEDWKSAAAYLKTRLKPEDIVVVYPYWVKAGFQLYSSHRFLATSQVQLENLTNFSRAWVISVYDTAYPANTPFPLREQANFNAISVRNFDLSSGKIKPSVLPDGVRYDFREHLDSAQVFVLPFGRSRSQPFPYRASEAIYLEGEEKGAGGEGLLFDAWQSDPISPGKKWHVVSRTVQKSGGVLRNAIWAHPPKNGTLIIRYPKVRLGKGLSGFYGFTDLSEKLGKAPVRFSIWLGSEKVYETLKGTTPGWNEFHIDTAKVGEGSDVEFRFEASNNTWRHFCFNAFIPQ